jgi:hypothetical protein
MKFHQRLNQVTLFSEIDTTDIVHHDIKLKVTQGAAGTQSGAKVVSPDVSS